MYGASCWGIITDEPNELINAAIEKGLKSAYVDSLGLSTIVYWRWVKS